MRYYSKPTANRRIGQPWRALLVCLTIYLLVAFCIQIINQYFHSHPELNPRWVEPGAVQVVAAGDDLYLFLEVWKMTRFRGLLISASVMPTAIYRYVIAISPSDEIQIVELDTPKDPLFASKDLSFHPNLSEIFCLDASIYCLKGASSQSGPRLYRYSEGKFVAVSDGPSAESAKLLRSKLEASTTHNGRILELMRGWESESEFIWRGSRYGLYQMNGVIELRRLSSPDSQFLNNNSVAKLRPLSSGVTFKYLGESEAKRDNVKREVLGTAESGNGNIP